MFDRITPVILTYNEAPNIWRTLNKLRWARRVVVVDSFSEDETLGILGAFSNVEVFERRFDSHARQWNFAIAETTIDTEWILALDADYVLTDDLLTELRGLAPVDHVSGYTASFRYCVFGKPLRGTLYPPVTVLFRRAAGSYGQDGHTQRLEVDGEVVPLAGKILHDDRKSLSRWLQAQDRYMTLEAEHIAAAPWNSLRTADKLRRLIFAAPLVVFVYCLLVKLAIFGGRAGWYYAMQRLLAEVLLGLRLLERSVKR